MIIPPKDLTNGCKDITKYKIDGNHIGVVMYAESCVYPAQEENEEQDQYKQRLKEVHIKADKKDIYDAFSSELFDKYRVIVEDGVVGHEHGEVNCKCHMQCVFRLTKRTQKQFCTGSIQVGTEKLLYMVGPVKSVQWAYHYCKKELDYYSTDNNDAQLDPYVELANSTGLSRREAIDIMVKGDPKALMTFGDRIINNWESFQPKPTKPEDPFQFPEYIYRQMYEDRTNMSEEDLEYVEALDEIHSWFQEFCISKQWVLRKKALFIFSAERGAGKTQFALSLLKDPKHAIHIKTNIDGRDFSKHPDAALLIIDDVKFRPEQEELWKALVSSEKTTISTKFCMCTWEGAIPTIILSNDWNLLYLMTESDNFNTQVKVVDCPKFIGPQDSRPKFLTVKEVKLSKKTLKRLERMKQKAEGGNQKLSFKPL